MLPFYPKLSKAALIIGQTDYLLRPVAKLLDRAGFEVSVIYRGDSLKLFSKVNLLCISKSHEALMKDIQNILHQNFDLVILTDDLMIAAILHSNLPEEIKARILPVTSSAYWSHLCSKNALSTYLEKSKVLQPQFSISQSRQDLEKDALVLGFPLLLKIDFSGGGAGVFECANLEQVRATVLPPNCFPLLLQKKICGAVIDHSGFFYQGQLIHYSYAQFVSCNSFTFTPSVVRLYSARHTVDLSIVDELNKLGRTLGLHGFANISCIRSDEDGKYYYFEADVRPNVWVNFPYYLNDDPAKAINHFFMTNEIWLGEARTHKGSIHQLQIPYVFRLSFLEISSNKYRVWKYMQEYSLGEISFYFAGLAHSQIMRWRLSALRMLQVLKQRLYHRPIYLMEANIIKHVIPVLPNKIATKLAAIYKRLRAMGRGIK